MEDMAKMSLRQLKTLPSFTIFNQYGKVKFHKPDNAAGIDLTEVNLARDVDIEANSVEVYSENNDGSSGAVNLVKPLCG